MRKAENGNSLIFHTLSFKNFLTFGNKETTIKLDDDLVSVVIGDNLDYRGSKNGTGKSGIVDALCYCLFGKTIRDIPNPKLINKYSRKGQAMVVTVNFTKGEYEYLVERSERPSKLLFLRKPVSSEEDIRIRENRKLKFDISRSKPETTNEICGILGFDITLFEFLVANSSESQPFFRMREADRREVIEKLFGFSIMSEKAEILKKHRKTEKDNLLKAESALATNVAANERISKQVREMETKSESWADKKENTIAELKETISMLESCDFEEEIELLTLSNEFAAKAKEIKSSMMLEMQREVSVKTDISRIDKDTKRLKKELQHTTDSLDDMEQSTCPTCKQRWVADPEFLNETKENKLSILGDLRDIEENLPELKSTLEAIQKEIQSHRDDLQECNDTLQEVQNADLVFDSVEEATKASAKLEMMRQNLEDSQGETNPFLDSIEDLKNEAIVEIDDSEVKELKLLIRHFDFLIELLTNKNSFIRKKVIDRWLPKLNQRISSYLDALELPYRVAFSPDMSINITRFDEEFSYGNLSKGERVRVIVALNLSFQDVFEMMNYRINFLCIDELIDNGICPRGAENTVNVLEQMAMLKHKRILLVTHRDDIAARVPDTMIVQKENDTSKVIHGEPT